MLPPGGPELLTPVAVIGRDSGESEALSVIVSVADSACAFAV